ncbi:MAG: 6-hydroxy-3-succinoylpyridine 3-monooxygenase [Colwellia sp.]
MYIDGYNLYYGCLKGTNYKWLDLFKLFNDYILPSSSPSNFTINEKSIKFFTADIIDKAAMSSDSLNDQRSYHHALKLNSQDNSLEIIKGYYSVTSTRAFHIEEGAHKKLPNQCQKVNVWKLEEKQTDVNIAVESLYDVLTDNTLEQVVFVTNDTDLAPALAKIASLNKVNIGLVIPTTDSVRQPNAELVKHADWTRKNITINELQLSQLPRIIHGERKPAIKPIGWFGQPTIIEQIIQTLLLVEKNRTKCWRWLELEPPIFPDLPQLTEKPIDLLNDLETANIVLQYALKYVQIKQS